MKKIIKFFRIKWLQRKLLRLYVAVIIEGQATRGMSCFNNLFCDEAEEIRRELYKVKYGK